MAFHLGGGGRITDGSILPFEIHPTTPGELSGLAERFERLAGRSVDLTGLTNQRFVPAQQSWDGLAAPELAAAPTSVREDAAQSSDAMVWMAGALRYWQDRVAAFNTRVGGIADTQAEARQGRYGLPADATDDDLFTARGEHERQMRERWWTAYRECVEDGSAQAASMLREGPTAENLRLLADAGVWASPPPVVQLLMPRWNDQAMRDLADEMAELVERINDPEYVFNQEDLERLEEILSEYADDEAFAYYFLDQIGPDGMLALTGNIALMQADGRAVGEEIDEELASLVGSIQASLGVALATATTRRNPGETQYPERGQYELDSQWRADLLAAGREKMALPWGDVYGYQLLGVLLQSPEADFDTSFLTQVGRNMLDFELEHGWEEGLIWEETAGYGIAAYERLNWIEGSEGNDGYDPIVGLLSALERDPEAARDFFTGVVTGDGRLPHVDYLLTDRAWPPDYMLDPGRDSGDTPPGQVLLGDVLVNATTDNPDHDSYNIVESIIYELATDEQASGYRNDPTGEGRELGEQAGRFRDVDLLPDELRQSMGEIASYYVDSMFWNTLSGADIPDGAPGEHVVNADPQHTQLFLAEIGRNPDARDQVEAATALYAGTLYDYYLDDGTGTFDPGRLAAADDIVNQGAGLVFGSLDFGSASQTVGDIEAQDTAYNEALHDRYFLAKLVTNEVLSRAGAPGPIGAVLSEAMSQAEQSQQADHTGEANARVGDLRGRGRETLLEMAQAAAYLNLTQDPNQVAQLPPELVDQGGQSIPFNQWGDAQLAAWERHVADPANQLTVLATPGQQYDQGYDRAQGDIESY